MVLARQLAESFADVVGGGRLLDAEDFVIVFGWGRHYWVSAISFQLTSHHLMLCHPERSMIAV